LRKRLITACVNVNPQRFSLRSDSMAIRPFLVVHTRIEGFAPGERNERERKLICGVHCSEECLVIL
jgi:hypothetical protein